ASVQLKDGLALTLADDCQNEDIARRRHTTIRRETGPELVKVLTAALGTRVVMEQDPNNPDNPPGGAEQSPSAGLNPGMMPGRSLVPPPGRPGTLGGGMAGPGGPGGPGGPFGVPG